MGLFTLVACQYELPECPPNIEFYTKQATLVYEEQFPYVRIDKEGYLHNAGLDKERKIYLSGEFMCIYNAGSTFGEEDFIYLLYFDCNQVKFVRRVTEEEFWHCDGFE